MTSPKASSTNQEIHNVWQVVEKLQTDVGMIQQAMAGLMTKLDTIATATDRLNEFSTKARQTNWSNVIAAIGVLIALISMGGAAALSPLYVSSTYTNTALQKHIETTNSAIQRHIEIEGHPAAMMLHAANKKDIERIDGDVQETKDALTALDDVLQREMRALDSVQITRLDNLDTTLQREMRMLGDIEAAKREALEQRVQGNENNFSPQLVSLADRIIGIESTRYSKADATRHEQLTEGLNREQSERLAALEATLRELKASLHSRNK